MPTIAFPIERTGYYRTLGPIIAAAIADPSWDVELVLGPATAAVNQKAYQNPTADNVPAPLRQGARISAVDGLAGAAERLGQADVVVSILGRGRILGPYADRARAPLWCAAFDADHSVRPEHRFDDADLNFWPSRYYVDWTVAVSGRARPEIEAKAHEVGYVRADSLALTSRERTRRAWGVPTDRRVVLYIPDGYRLTPNAAFVTDWYRHVWCVESRAERVVRAIALRRRWRALREALGEQGSDAAVVRALRAFCDKNGAELVMARRQRKNWDRKEAFTAAELAAGGRVVEEQENYPQTLPKAAQMADLVVCGYRSGAALDAIAAGVPYVTVAVPAIAESAENQAYARRFDAEQGHHPGATWLFAAHDFIERFATRALSDFAIDPTVLGSLRNRYVGAVDGRASRRLLDAVRARLAGRVAANQGALQGR